MSKSPKKIVIVHYHLRAGGVTTVIQRQLLALNEHFPNSEIILLVGETPNFTVEGVTVVVDSALLYSTFSNREEAYRREVYLLKLLLTMITSQDTLFHFHNPTLGKNPALTGAIHSLADKRVPIVMMCHDFSEDRESNHALNMEYASWADCDIHSFLYPDRENIHYLTINSFDLNRKHWESLKYSRVSLLAPPVGKITKSPTTREEIAQSLGINSNKEWILYPVRGIDRKNIGELILLAVLDGFSREWIVAREPINSVANPEYAIWRALINRLDLPILLNGAAKVSFEALYHSCNRVVTTSYKEGFGLAYLEPWYISKSLFGREISYVVNDMRDSGVAQDFLYKELLVPNHGSWVDFITLSLDERVYLIERVVVSQKLRDEIIAKNSWWSRVWSRASRLTVESNRLAIEKNYSIHSFGDKIAKLYISVV